MTFASKLGHDIEKFGLCQPSREEVVEILSQAFTDDAFHRYVLYTWRKGSTLAESGVDKNRIFFTHLLQQLDHEGALNIGMPGSSLAMVCNVEAVGSSGDDTSGGGEPDVPSALVEMEGKSSAILGRLFEPHRTVLHIYLVGKDSRSNADANLPAKDLLLKIIQLATSKDWPIYLEATSAKSRDLFKSVGFEIVQEVKVGVGKVDSNGSPSERGSGVRLWVATFLPKGGYLA